MSLRDLRSYRLGIPSFCYTRKTCPNKSERWTGCDPGPSVAADESRSWPFRARGRRVGPAGQRLARSKAEAVASPPRGRSAAASVVLPVRNRVPTDGPGSHPDGRPGPDNDPRLGGSCTHRSLRFFEGYLGGDGGSDLFGYNVVGSSMAGIPRSRPVDGSVRRWPIRQWSVRRWPIRQWPVRQWPVRQWSVLR